MSIKYFSKFNIEAGITTKDEGDANTIRADLITENDLLVKAGLVHGIDICIIDESALKEGSYLEIRECDGLITNLKNVMLTTTHGDCIPVYAYDPKKQVIGLAHAGWRGTADCIVNALIYWMHKEYKCRAKDIHIAIGAGIGMCCFEVDQDVYDYFTDEMPWTEDYMIQKPNGKFAIDLKGINCELAEIEGVPAENIFIDDNCTACPENKEKFFSYRRDRCKERMLAYIKQ